MAVARGARRNPTRERVRFHFLSWQMERGEKNVEAGRSVSGNWQDDWRNIAASTSNYGARQTERGDIATDTPPSGKLSKIQLDKY